MGIPAVTMFFPLNCPEQDAEALRVPAVRTEDGLPAESTDPAPGEKGFQFHTDTFKDLSHAISPTVSIMLNRQV